MNGVAVNMQEDYNNARDSKLTIKIVLSQNFEKVLKIISLDFLDTENLILLWQNIFLFRTHTVKSFVLSANL